MTGKKTSVVVKSRTVAAFVLTRRWAFRWDGHVFWGGGLVGLSNCQNLPIHTFKICV